MITSHWCCVWKQSYQMNTHLSLYVSACQCNGHSTCVNGSVCEQCKNLTTGPQCQICLPGYYGDPTNGGKCQGEIFLFMCMCTSICLSVCVLVCICIWKSESVSLRMILSLWNKINLAEYLDVVFHWMKVNNTYGYQATKNTSTTKVVNLSCHTFQIFKWQLNMKNKAKLKG